jgi:hypothetical protein
MQGLKSDNYPGVLPNLNYLAIEVLARLLSRRVIVGAVNDIGRLGNPAIRADWKEAIDWHLTPHPPPGCFIGDSRTYKLATRAHKTNPVARSAKNHGPDGAYAKRRRKWKKCSSLFEVTGESDCMTLISFFSVITIFEPCRSLTEHAAAAKTLATIAEGWVQIDVD